MKKYFSKIREYIPLFSLCVYLLTIISLALYLIVLNNTDFADFFNYNITAPFRLVLTWSTVIFPFSLVEIFLLLSPFILIFLIFLAVRYGKRGPKTTVRYISVLISFLCIVFICFVWTYSSGYHTSKIEDKMNLDRTTPTNEELYQVTDKFVTELNALVSKIEYDETGASVMPYSYSEMSEKICDAYDRFVEKNGIIRTFPSKIKPIILSEPMTYTHLSGIYSFMSGESNVNVNYPDYVIATTSAHEMAHQRGYAREDECNFLAFAVLLESDDPFLRYCAYLDVYSNIANALYSADSKTYFELAARLDARVYKDMQSYSEFFKKYENSKASEVTGSINDSYLQANGQEEGTKSYGMIVEIVCAYVLNKTK
ncbi:DUF3810 domain-containing protein [Ruminococcus sp.]|uniref:DUF3810 domain-containing protein n=1 Tax=Ruminococcus sp. TaxID=41978 RepID=UPI00386BFA76